MGAFLIKTKSVTCPPTACLRLVGVSANGEHDAQEQNVLTIHTWRYGYIGYPWQAVLTFNRTTLRINNSILDIHHSIYPHQNCILTSQNGN